MPQGKHWSFSSIYDRDVIRCINRNRHFDYVGYGYSRDRSRLYVIISFKKVQKETRVRKMFGEITHPSLQVDKGGSYISILEYNKRMLRKMFYDVVEYDRNGCSEGMQI